MKFRKRRKGHSAVEASALADILFFLLLFFLMVSTLASPSAIEVLLPKADTGKSIPKNIINVTVDKNTSYYVEGSPVAFDNLKNEIALKAKNANDNTVILRVDQAVDSGKMIEVIDIVNQLKIPIVIATEKK